MKNDSKRLFGQLLEQGMNMWIDLPCPRPTGEYASSDLYTPPKKMLDKWGPIFWEGQRLRGKADFLRFDEECWREVTAKMAAADFTAGGVVAYELAEERKTGK